MRAIIYSPRQLGGIGYPSIENEQDKNLIYHFIHQLEWDKEVGQDIRIVLSQLQLQSGFVSPLMEDPDLIAPHLKQGWLSFLRERMARLNGSIALQDQWAPILQRVNDTSIMEAFCKLKQTKQPGATNVRLQAANDVRIWLRSSVELIQSQS